LFAATLRDKAANVLVNAFIDLVDMIVHSDAG
jgi:hypothetical protein